MEQLFIIKFIKLLTKAQRFYIMSATSVASESAFSVAGYIQRKERTRLSSKNLRFTILAKQMDKLIEIEQHLQLKE